LLIKGGDENAAAPHFHPLPLFASNPVAERSRGHFYLEAKKLIFIFRISGFGKASPKPKINQSSASTN